MDMEEPNKKKLVIVGDGNTGKTCLLTVLCKGIFPDETTPTTFDIFTKEFVIDSEEIELTLWDTAGQEEYEKLRPLSYSDTDVILLCFSIDAPSSFVNIPEIWIPEVEYFCPNVPIVLVGTKKDLRHNPYVLKDLAKKRQEPVQYDEGVNMCKKLKLFGYVECSALNNDNVHKVFDTACRATMKRKKKCHCRCCECIIL